MGEASTFTHQRYDRPDPRGRFRCVATDTVRLTDAAESIVSSVAESLSRLVERDYRAIILLRGTFVGVDPLGLARKLSRVWPEGARRLRLSSRRFIDRFAGDAGNYGDDTLALLEAAARQASQSVHGGARGEELRVVTVNWSGENHHAGRADGAVRLTRIVADLQRSTPADSRCLIVGHSHGGNVAAIASQLWAANAQGCRKFLRAARTLYRSPWFRLGKWLSRIDQPTWQWLTAELDRAPATLVDGRRCAVVTLGTPVRYGWGPLCTPHGLLHFIHHGFPAQWHQEQVESEALWKAEFPPPFRSSSPGDMVQQVGIAGTNFPLSLLSYRARLANQRLGRLLQPGASQSLLDRLSTAPRLHDAGLNLLVDYRHADPEADDVLGHAVYTRRRWLPFHFQQIAQHLVSE